MEKPNKAILLQALENQARIAADYPMRVREREISNYSIQLLHGFIQEFAPEAPAVPPAPPAAPSETPTTTPATKPTKTSPRK